MQTILIIAMLLCGVLAGYGFGYFQGCKESEKLILEYYDLAQECLQLTQKCLQHSDECLEIAEKYKEKEN